MRFSFTALVLIGAALPVSAQWLDRPWPGIPRTADGEPDLAAPAPRGGDGNPDLTGLWTAPPPVAQLDPAILLPWVAELARERQQDFYRMRPFFQCLPSGPETERAGGWKRFIQTPSMLAILNADLTHRVIHLDDRELEPEPIPSWTGYAVGHWEGDTLVVETRNFTDKLNIGRAVHSEDLVLTERFTRIDPDMLNYIVTVDDPRTFEQPWTFRMTLTTQPGYEILEYSCHEGNFFVANALRAEKNFQESVAAAIANGDPIPQRSEPGAGGSEIYQAPSTEDAVNINAGE